MTALGLKRWMFPGGYGSYPVQPDPEQVRQALGRQADTLQAELETIRRRIEEIDAAASDS
jgi:hypothetical protein